MKARRVRLATSQRSEREEAKRFATNLSTGLLIIGAIAALVMVANRWDRHEELRAIRINGRHVLDSAEIIPKGLIADSLPLRSLDLAAIEQGVAMHPFIENASVYRGENGVLVIDVTERRPVAATVIDGEVFYVDSLASLLPGRFGTVAVDLPLISGIDPRSVAGRLALDSAKAREALAVMYTIRDHSETLYRQISEICRLPEGEYELRTADGGVPVLVGTPRDVAGRLGKFDRFLTSIVAEQGIGSLELIDLRWKGEVVVRWKSREG